MTKHKHDLAFSTNSDTGRVSVGVRLSKRQERAWLYEDDYRRIIAERGEGKWYLNSNGFGLSYVRVNQPILHRPEMLARIVTGERPRRVIKYRDGNRLNLRADNLVVCKGHGGVKHKRPRAGAVDEFAVEMV